MSLARPATPRLPAPDRRHQLLDAALDLFASKGFNGTTTKEIAAAAGVTEAIIFRHFPNKHALYDAVLEYHHDSKEFRECLAEWQSLMDRNDDAGLIRSIIERIIASYRRDARPHRVLLYAALEGHETGLAHYRQRSMPLFELLCQYVARRQSEGALRGSNPKAIVAAAAGMATNYAMMTQMFGFRANTDDRQIAESFTRILMEGIQPAL